MLDQKHDAFFYKALQELLSKMQLECVSLIAWV